MRIGVHGRNDVQWAGADLDVIEEAGIQTLKMMSHTSVEEFLRIRQRFPDMEFIVRLYDDRINSGGHVTATEFTSKMVPIIKSLGGIVRKFEIHNEPNHAAGIEGWGDSDEHARSFNEWFLLVLAQLLEAVPWASYGFPGLAVAQRDVRWLDLCAPAISAADWLGVHCYWQYENNLNETWGLRYKRYHAKFPDKPIEVTEFGDSSPGLSDEDMARKIVAWYQYVMREPYIQSASAFILSSPDPTWYPFCWRLPDRVRPVVQAVGAMPRTEPALRIDNISASLPRAPKNGPGGKIPKRKLSDIGRIVIHHTVTPQTFPIKSIARYHVYTRHWPTIGYTFIVDGDGNVSQCAPLSTVTYHAGAGYNTESLGIALTGTFMGGRRPTEAQLEATSRLIGHVCATLGRIVPVFGHKELVQTACPGDTWPLWRARLTGD